MNSKQVKALRKLCKEKKLNYTKIKNFYQKASAIERDKFIASVVFYQPKTI